MDESSDVDAHTRGLLRRMIINSGSQHHIGKEVSQFEQGKDGFIESIDDMCIHFEGGGWQLMKV